MAKEKIDPRFVVKDDGEENPMSRKTPIHRVTNVHAEGGMVCIEGVVGDKASKKLVTRREAIARARALIDMMGRMTYPSDISETQRVVDMFVKAIEIAKKQDGGRYTSTRVSMAISSMDPSSPLFSGNKQVAPAHGDKKIIV